MVVNLVLDLGYLVYSGNIGARPRAPAGPSLNVHDHAKHEQTKKAMHPTAKEVDTVSGMIQKAQKTNRNEPDEPDNGDMAESKATVCFRAASLG